jgi:hypothetical protein
MDKKEKEFQKKLLSTFKAIVYDLLHSTAARYPEKNTTESPPQHAGDLVHLGLPVVHGSRGKIDRCAVIGYFSSLY